MTGAIVCIVILIVCGGLLSWVGRGAWSSGFYDEYAGFALVGNTCLIFGLFCLIILVGGVTA